MSVCLLLRAWWLMLQGWQDHSMQDQVAGVPALASMSSSDPTVATAPSYHTSNHLVTHSPSCWLLCDPKGLYYFSRSESVCAFSLSESSTFLFVFNKDFPQNVFKIPILVNRDIFLYLSGGPKPPTPPSKGSTAQNEALKRECGRHPLLPDIL